ncbi:MAG TPA: class I SAM-dependent methyltransferase [Gemmatimonadaceae bacterium]
MAGIPDLRAIRDADITVARERADARLLAEMLARENAGHSEQESVLAFGDFVANERRRHSGALALRTGDEVLAEWQGLDQEAPNARVVLDVGCGLGSLLEAAARRWPVCVGVDTDLRALVVARHRLQQAGIRARLVCANVDALPFADGLFDRVVARSILELSPRKERALREWNRMLSPRGRLWIATSNRWSVSRDPQLGIPAVSWLPVRLLDWWAKWHGLSLPQRALVGTRRLRRLLEETGFDRVRLGEPISDESNGASEPGWRAMIKGHKSLSDLPLVRGLAKQVNPILFATAQPAPRMPRRVAYERYVARLAV